MVFIFDINVPNFERQALVESTLSRGDWVLYVNDNNRVSKEYTFVVYDREMVGFIDPDTFAPPRLSPRAALSGRASGPASWFPVHVLSEPYSDAGIPVISPIADRIYVGQEAVMAGAKKEGLESPLENWVHNYKAHQGEFKSIVVR